MTSSPPPRRSRIQSSRRYLPILSAVTRFMPAALVSDVLLGPQAASPDAWSVRPCGPRCRGEGDRRVVRQSHGPVKLAVTRGNRGSMGKRRTMGLYGDAETLAPNADIDDPPQAEIHRPPSFQ